MPFRVGIDIGHQQLAVAVFRRRSGDDPAETERPGEGTIDVPAVLHLDELGFMQVGDDAREAGIVAPQGLVSGFHERMGDDIPVRVAGGAYPVSSLSAALIAWAAARTERIERGRPISVAVTHPGGWGAYRRNQLRAALAAEGLPDVVLTPSPVAVMNQHTVAGAPAEDGSTAATLLLGELALTPTLLRRTNSGGWQILDSGETGSEHDAMPPVDAVSKVHRAVLELHSLARHAHVDLSQLTTIALYGSSKVLAEVGDQLRKALPCRPVALPHPEHIAAMGAAAHSAARVSPVARATTTLLPEIDGVSADERPVRPAVNITPPRLPRSAARTRPRPRRLGPVAALSAALAVTAILSLRADVAPTAHGLDASGWPMTATETTR